MEEGINGERVQKLYNLCLQPILFLFVLLGLNENWFQSSYSFALPTYLLSQGSDNWQIYINRFSCLLGHILYEVVFDVFVELCTLIIILINTRVKIK